MANIITGTTLDENLSGTAQDDQITGLAGNDTILGNAGDDLIYGNQGNDSIDGTAAAAIGSDTIYGGQGNDTIGEGLGGAAAGNDLLYGNFHNDLVTGGVGSDTLYGGQDNDSLGGNAGQDLIYGNLGNDAIRGGTGDDTMYGGQGNDTFIAEPGDDLIYGNFADDILNAGGGSTGNDTLYGGQGNDLIFEANAVAGVDRMFGNLGADTFDFQEQGPTVSGQTDATADHIADFKDSENDRVRVVAPAGVVYGETQGDATVVSVQTAITWTATHALNGTPGPDAFGPSNVVFVAGVNDGYLLVDANNNGAFGGGDYAIVLDGLNNLSFFGPQDVFS